MGKHPDKRILRAYLRLVKERTKVEIELGEGPRSRINEVLENCNKVKAHPEDFIQAQFDLLSPEFCVRVWKTPYPPVHMLRGMGARTRYQRWVKGLVVTWEPVVEEYLRSSEKKARGKRVHWILLAVTGGVIHPAWVGKRVYEGAWPTEKETFLSIPEVLAWALKWEKGGGRMDRNKYEASD